MRYGALFNALFTNKEVVNIKTISNDLHGISIKTLNDKLVRDFKVTHQAHVIVACFYFFCDEHGRTDTMRENNDHLFGRGLVAR